MVDSTSITVDGNYLFNPGISIENGRQINPITIVYQPAGAPSNPWAPNRQAACANFQSDAIWNHKAALYVGAGTGVVALGIFVFTGGGAAPVAGAVALLGGGAAGVAQFASWADVAIGNAFGCNTTDPN
ncbi:MAG: hypothetical protein ABR923_18180 [Terracidiphilus sp.]